MSKKMLTLALACLVVLAQTGVRAATQAARDVDSMEKIKASVDRAGLGEKARVTVKMKDGTERKGYVSERRDAEFVLRDRKTDAPAIIPYNDVARVHVDRGHSTARNTALGVGIGAGAVILTLAILIASIDD